MNTVTDGAAGGDELACHWHPDTRGGVTCQRCDRRICPQCMHQQSVGFHCPECAGSDSRSVMAPAALSTLELPDGPNQPPRFATQTLCALNVAGFVYSVANGGGLRTIVGSTTFQDGALYARYEPLLSLGPAHGVSTGEYYRLLTSAFLHDGLIHLGLNLLALWLLGSMLEAGYGWVRLTSLYLMSLLGGALGVMLSQPNAWTVGASGAVFGLLGAMVLVERAVGMTLFRSSLGSLLLISLGLTLLLPDVSVGGHFGGLLAGLFMGWILLRISQKDLPGWLAVTCGVFFSSALAAGAIWASLRWHDPLLGGLIPGF